MNQAWAGHPGTLVESIAVPPVAYTPAGAVVPSKAPDDFSFESFVPGALAPFSPLGSIGLGPADEKSSGLSNIRTGEPGQVCKILVGPGIIGPGHLLDSVSLAFRYSVGYTHTYGWSRFKAPTVRVYLADVTDGKELATLGSTGPLGNYSFDGFTAYSPELRIAAAGLGLPNERPIAIVMEVTNRYLNLQMPIDDKADGWNIRATWKPAEPNDADAEPEAAAVHPLLSAPGRGQLWAKRQPGGGSAALFINHSPTPLSYTLSMAKLNLTAAAYKVRDVWAGTSNGTAAGSLRLSVPPYDSAFVTLSPV